MSVAGWLCIVCGRARVWVSFEKLGVDVAVGRWAGVSRRWMDWLHGRGVRAVNVSGRGDRDGSGGLDGMGYTSCVVLEMS